LWRRWSGDLIGVPTGPVNGFDVLDIDPRHGGDAWLSEYRFRLPTTRTHETRSGGLHILFQHAEGVRNSAGKIGAGVDVRGAGGYIIWWPAAGCSVENHALAEWPAWLLRVLIPQPPPQPLARRGVGGVQGVEAMQAARIVAAALARLEMAGAGQKHERLRAAARTLGGVADAAGFSDHDAEEVLFAAVLRAGGAEVRERNARATIRWGLSKGRSVPLSLERGR
jgi:hypothetical protein